MSRRIVALVVAVALLAGGVVFYQWWNSPEQVLARMQARMDAEAKRVVDALPAAIREGPGIERLDPSSVLKRAVLTKRGARIEIDAGDGGVVLGRRLVHFRERNGRIGAQQGDAIASTTSYKPSDPEKAKQTDWIQSTDGYGTAENIDDRGSVEFGVTTRDADGKKTEVEEVFGPAIDLAVEASSTSRLIWHRRGGPTLRWRMKESSLELEFRGADPKSLRGVEVEGKRRFEFKSSGDAPYVAEIPATELAEMRRAGVRLVVRLGDAEGSIRLELVRAKS